MRRTSRPAGRWPKEAPAGAIAAQATSSKVSSEFAFGMVPMVAYLCVAVCDAPSGGARGAGGWRGAVEMEGEGFYVNLPCPPSILRPPHQGWPSSPPCPADGGRRALGPC